MTDPALNWRPGGGSCWFLPSLPMVGTIANQHQAMSRRILRERGLEFITEYVCGPRMSREEDHAAEAGRVAAVSDQRCSRSTSAATITVKII